MKGNWLENLQIRDEQTFYWINQRWRSAAMDWLMRTVTWFGGALFSVSLCIYLLSFHPALRGIAVKGAIALAASHLVVQILKRSMLRLRPHMTLMNTFTVRNPLSDSSFPSGHTTASFSLATAFAIGLPALSSLFLALATLVALSRVYLGLHYPSDVGIGALLGAGTSVLVSVLL